MIDTGAVLPPGATLGVVGGGQLGRMFVQAAQRLGYRTAVLTPSADSPAAQVAHEVIVGRPGDLEGLRALSEGCAAVTVEFENVSAPGLRWLGRRTRVRPGWRTIWVAQDRIREKTFLQSYGFPTAPWSKLTNDEELNAARSVHEDGGILKTSASGYDGKGQVRVRAAEELESAWRELGRVPCVVEGVVDFAAEVSCVVARGGDGATACYPLFLNTHTRHILDTTIAPAPVGPVVSCEARELASAIATALGTSGLLTVEMFLTRDGRLLVNELAPRPHNSGHLTIEAAATSQFEQQVRALCGLPLGSGRLHQPAAMANLLGDLWVAGEPDWTAALRGDPDISLHLYGKASARPGRKMGHLTATGPDVEQALLRVVAARGALARG